MNNTTNIKDTVRQTINAAVRELANFENNDELAISDIGSIERLATLLNDLCRFLKFTNLT